MQCTRLNESMSDKITGSACFAKRDLGADIFLCLICIFPPILVPLLLLQLGHFADVIFMTCSLYWFVEFSMVGCQHYLMMTIAGIV